MPKLTGKIICPHCLEDITKVLVENFLVDMERLVKREKDRVKRLLQARQKWREGIERHVKQSKEES